jgi:hypothetical protein
MRPRLFGLWQSPFRNFWKSPEIPSVFFSNLCNQKAKGIFQELPLETLDKVEPDNHL